MKKVNIIILSLLAFLTIAPLQLSARSEKAKTPSTSDMESVRATELLKRLDEINEMDKSAMNRADKKETRKEVREIKKELKTLGNGVYISVGAIIIILLLLILLL